jgi:hypothetical protein
MKLRTTAVTTKINESGLYAGSTELDVIDTAKAKAGVDELGLSNFEKIAFSGGNSAVITDGADLGVLGLKFAGVLSTVQLGLAQDYVLNIEANRGNGALTGVEGASADVNLLKGSIHTDATIDLTGVDLGRNTGLIYDTIAHNAVLDLDSVAKGAFVQFDDESIYSLGEDGSLLVTQGESTLTVDSEFASLKIVDSSGEQYSLVELVGLIQDNEGAFVA